MSAVIGAIPYDKLRFSAFLGKANTALTVTVKVERIDDGLWWDGVSAWGAVPTAIAMVEPDVTHLTGSYEYEMPAGGNDKNLSQGGYRFFIDELTLPFNDGGVLNTWIPERVLGASITDNLAAGNLADFIFRIGAARHFNTRIINTAWNAAGRPTAGFVLGYVSKAALDGDTGPAWAAAALRFDVAILYDGSGNLTSYESTKTT